MQRITIINIKGGCGKTTIATNLASALSGRGRNTTLIDYDPQGCSMYWLKQRPEEASKINGLSAFPTNQAVTRSWQLRLPQDTDYVIVDTPAGLSGLNLIDQLKGSHTIVIPVLPSSIDTHATADFIRDLYLIAKVQPKKTRLCIICNRVKPNTLSFRALERFLDAMDIPVIASLRETQNYIKAADAGLGIHELDADYNNKMNNKVKKKTNDKDAAQWHSIVSWLEAAHSKELPLSNTEAMIETTTETTIKSVFSQQSDIKNIIDRRKADRRVTESFPASKVIMTTHQY